MLTFFKILFTWIFIYVEIIFIISKFILLLILSVNLGLFCEDKICNHNLYIFYQFFVNLHQKDQDFSNIFLQFVI